MQTYASSSLSDRGVMIDDSGAQHRGKGRSRCVHAGARNQVPFPPAGRAVAIEHDRTVARTGGEGRPRPYAPADGRLAARQVALGARHGEGGRGHALRASVGRPAGWGGFSFRWSPGRGRGFPGETRSKSMERSASGRCRAVVCPIVRWACAAARRVIGAGICAPLGWPLACFRLAPFRMRSACGGVYTLYPKIIRLAIAKYSRLLLSRKCSYSYLYPARESTITTDRHRQSQLIARSFSSDRQN